MIVPSMAAVPRRSARRGSVYIAVLGIALLVTVIGLSALLAVRVEQRVASATEAAVKADFGAQSVIDLAMFWIAADLSWRTTYAHDTWTSEQVVGDASVSYKLVDEQDGDLANDSTQPVHLYGKATTGDAVRIYSVLLQEPDSSIDNLLSNPGMESGTTDWYGAWCDIESYTADRHSGSASLAAKNRSDYFSGPAQTITSTIESGTTYEAEAWVKMDSGTSVVRFVMYLRNQFSQTEWLVDGATPVGSSEWTRITGTLTPTLSGTLTEAYLKVSTESGTTGFYVDDVVMIEAPSGGDTNLLPILGSWRREVLP